VNDQVDLLGNEITADEAMAKPKRPKKSGHAAPPGTGPAGETCGSCEHYCRTGMNRVYRKCGKIQALWTHGPGTDIRKKDAACAYWEKEKPDVTDRPA
jgi:hypothetical protein